MLTRPFLFLLVAASLAASSICAHALDKISVEARVADRTDEAPGAAKGPAGKKLKFRRLMISANNSSDIDYTGARARYVIYAKDAKRGGGGDPQIVGQGEIDFSIGPKSSLKSETPEAKVEYTPAHKVTSRGKSTQVNASGKQFVGWTLQITKGEEVLVSKGSGPVFEKMVASAPLPTPPPTPAPSPAKKK